MQIAVNISTEDIIQGIRLMSFNELEKIKNAIVERRLYFQEFKKDTLENVVDDFKAEGYSDDFLADLQEGLKKSSIYNENKNN
ncbi:MAG: hypothetical protein GY765_33970 [bacterium]|nr:hypothetical protein [bacterium]